MKMMKNFNPHLFQNGDPEKLIGMNIGHLDYNGSGISYWINSFCYQNHKACVSGKTANRIVSVVGKLQLVVVQHRR
jgi:hypothetical protein